MQPTTDPAPGTAGAVRTATTRAAADAPRAGAPRVRELAESVGKPPFEALLEAHEIEIYRHLRRLAPTAEDAADLHQETFLRAFRAYPRLAAGANVRAWLYRIATNAAHDAHRRRAARARLAGAGEGNSGRHVQDPGEGPAAGALEPRAGHDVDPSAVAEANELAGAVRAALLELTARQRVAVVARVFEDQDYATVAEVLACSEVTARQHVHHGLQRLRALLSHHLEVPA